MLVRSYTYTYNHITKGQLHVHVHTRTALCRLSLHVHVVMAIRRTSGNYNTIKQHYYKRRTYVPKKCRTRCPFFPRRSRAFLFIASDMSCRNQGEPASQWILPNNSDKQPPLFQMAIYSILCTYTPLPAPPTRAYVE